MDNYDASFDTLTIDLKQVELDAESNNSGSTSLFCKGVALKRISDRKKRDSKLNMMFGEKYGKVSCVLPNMGFLEAELQAVIKKKSSVRYRTKLAGLTCEYSSSSGDESEEESKDGSGIKGLDRFGQPDIKLKKLGDKSCDSDDFASDNSPSSPSENSFGQNI